ncbi:MAG: hypothetical protein JO264_06790 [Acidisphaera sp.]|nr:hypothetical protein [Acidisphaera sp.]
MTRTRASLAMLAGSLLLAGCSVVDPYRRAGTWRPNQSNMVMRAEEVADPMDLVQGRSAEGAQGELATAAVERLRHDQVKSLSDSAIVQIGSPGGSGSGGGSGGGSGAGGGSPSGGEGGP